MTTLLDDDGTASIATFLMSSHHAFRRDVACFVRALGAPLDAPRAAALHEGWGKLREALHAHHTVEDTSMFPNLRAGHPALAAALDELERHHRLIDPLLERGHAAFGALSARRLEVREIVQELAALLAMHLELEEQTVTPHLRSVKEFPAPADAAALAMYADGFAWSTAGLAATVVEQINALLPAPLVERIAIARGTFDETCRKTWGYTHTGSSLTSIPGPA